MFVCFFGAKQGINPCGSDGIKLLVNMIWMEKEKIVINKMKGMMMISLYNDIELQYDC